MDNSVEKYLWLVDVIASKYRSCTEYEDYIQVGRIGLIKAAKRFDPDKGFKFETYATTVITGEIKRYQRDYGRLIKPSRSIYELNSKIIKLKHTGKSEEDICKLLKITIEKLNNAGAAMMPVMSLHESIYNDEDSLAIEETIEAEIDVENDYISGVEGKEKLRELLASISNEYLKILKLRMAGKSQSQIAKAIGCSQMRISRVLADIRGKYSKIHECYDGEVLNDSDSRCTKRSCAV